MGGLRSAQEGSLKILEQEIRGASKQQLTKIRQNIGYIFQAHNLMSFLTAKQNVKMSLELHNEFLEQNLDAKAIEILEPSWFRKSSRLLSREVYREDKNRELRSLVL